MKRIAFTMQLLPGKEGEYKMRHDAIWPELSILLRAYGISNYSIFLEPGTRVLFGVMNIADPGALDKLATEPVMQKWWDYMADIMDTNVNKSPKTIPLTEVFFLP